MTLTTPASGTWLVGFTSSGTMSSGTQTGEYGIFIDGGTTPVSGTRRSMMLNANNITGTLTAMATHVIVSVNGAQNIEVYYRTSGGSFSVLDRVLNAIKLA
jgi:hypothetical protein